MASVRRGEDVFEGRVAIGYDHGYDAQTFYLGLALDQKYVQWFVEGYLKRIGEDDRMGRCSCRACGRRGGERRSS